MHSIKHFTVAILAQELSLRVFAKLSGSRALITSVRDFLLSLSRMAGKNEKVSSKGPDDLDGSDCSDEKEVYDEETRAQLASCERKYALKEYEIIATDAYAAFVKDREASEADLENDPHAKPLDFALLKNANNRQVKLYEVRAAADRAKFMATLDKEHPIAKCDKIPSIEEKPTYSRMATTGLPLADYPTLPPPGSSVTVKNPVNPVNQMNKVNPAHKVNQVKLVKPSTQMCGLCEECFEIPEDGNVFQIRVSQAHDGGRMCGFRLFEKPCSAKCAFNHDDKIKEYLHTNFPKLFENKGCDPSKSAPLCRNLMNTGWCPWGKMCGFNHGRGH